MEPVSWFMGELDRALQALWRIRREARAKSREKSGRGEATAGKHMDPLSALLKEFIARSGLADAEFYEDRKAALPGYFRPLKTWDLVVRYRGALVIALELKSHIGSYGNNFNNRVEEALGSAVDLNHSLADGALSQHVLEGESGVIPPFRGWLMVLPWEKETTHPTKSPFQPLFPLDPAFVVAEEGPLLTSYVDRYREFIKRASAKKVYDAAALVLTKPQGGYHSDYNLKNFLELLAHHSRMVAKSG